VGPGALTHVEPQIEWRDPLVGLSIGRLVALYLESLDRLNAAALTPPQRSLADARLKSRLNPEVATSAPADGDAPDCRVTLGQPA
jgi:hypothetical protein